MDSDSEYDLEDVEEYEVQSIDDYLSGNHNYYYLEIYQ